MGGKCRDARLRRKAIELLRESEREEGVSNSLMAARVAESLVEIEEEGLLDGIRLAIEMRIVERGSGGSVAWRENMGWKVKGELGCSFRRLGARKWSY